MPTHWRFADKILSTPVGVVAGCIMLAIMMGCMSLSIGNRTVESEDSNAGVLCQQGEAHVPPDSSVYVRYPIPYPRIPNLDIKCTFDDCVIEDEKEDGFRLRNPNPFNRAVTWKARGMRPPPLPVPSNPTASPPPPETPTLPAPTPQQNG
jgi:hypothetical protein